MARSETSYTCSFCKMRNDCVIAGPSIYICCACATDYTETLKRPMALTASQMATFPKCSFCGQAEPAVHRVLTGANASICNGCLRHCNDILDKPSS